MTDQLFREFDGAFDAAMPVVNAIPDTKLTTEFEVWKSRRTESDFAWAMYELLKHRQGGANTL
jgi:hypothetical protein